MGQELKELREIVRSGLMETTRSLQERREALSLLLAYLNATADVELNEELWNTGAKWLRMQIMYVLRGVQCEVLADLAVRLAIQALESEPAHKPTLLRPRSAVPEPVSKFVLILAEYAERPLAREFIFRKLNESPFYFYPDEERIFRRICRDFPCQGEESAIADRLKQILKRNAEALRICR